MIEVMRVDAGSIEKSLAALWRSEHQEGTEAVTRAARWNVIAHTSGAADHTHAAAVLSDVASSVPQRTIVLRSEPAGDPGIAAWISANCHLAGDGKQVCSEEISIVGRGEALQRIPPLIHALLIPDMPVAVWWIGPLPSERSGYAAELLEVADRLIFDSAQFHSLDDLDLMLQLARRTRTSLADLNWIRLEEWRQATAAMFDPPSMQERLTQIRTIGIAAMERSQANLYAAWLIAQAGLDPSSTRVILSAEEREGSPAIEIDFESGPSASLTMRDNTAAIVGGCEAGLECVTRLAERRLEDLLIRQLRQPQTDVVFLRTLEAAASLPR